MIRRGLCAPFSRLVGGGYVEPNARQHNERDAPGISQQMVFTTVSNHDAQAAGEQ